jgi:predicted TIM-barrel fold metal-dependent hydrolase
MSSSSEPSAAAVAGEIVDADLWVQKASFSLIGPYLPSSWRQWLRIGERLPTGGTIELPESQYFVPGPALKRGQTLEDPQSEVGRHLDLTGLRAAVLNPGAATSISGLASPLLAAEAARAVNEWTADRWLQDDGRLLGSIVVSLTDPRRAAQEIRRAATADARMAQVVIAYPPRLLGDRWFHPIYEAAAEASLPIVLQSGGDYSGANPGLTAVGNPVTPFEAFVGWEAGGPPHLVSLILNGVFDRFPQLRVVMSGFGVAWLPAIIWRLDMEYRAGRVSAPVSLTRRPSEYLSDHVRLTTSTLELPADPGDLERLMSMVSGERLMVFGSGPLRGDEPDGLAEVPLGWYEHLRRNSAELYPAVARAAASA